MRNIFIILLSAIILLSCAKIPVQSVALADAIQVEGERMHNLNLVLLNRIFGSKRMAIEKFIHDEYTPTAVKNFVSLVSERAPGTDFKKEFPELMQAITPKINQRRDSLISALDYQKEKLVEKLNADYKVFNDAAYELKNLLGSAVKIDKEKQALFDQAKLLSKNRVDFNTIEMALDKFIHSAGNVSANITSLNNDINQLLNNK